MKSPGHMDAMEVLAYPLPVTVIAEMLGIAPEDRHRFKQWSDDISVILSGDVGGLPEAAVKRAFEARAELVDYFRSVVAKNRAGSGSDLLTALARAEEGGGRLSEAELYSTAVLIRTFERLGWAHDVRWPKPERLAARRAA